MPAYIQYKLINTQPLSISENGTISYIPGTAIRGFIISQLAQKNPEEFEHIKVKLFSEQTKFLNCYPIIDKNIMLPSPKGFQEKKNYGGGQSEIKNSLLSNCKLEGYKTASPETFCELEGYKTASLETFAYWEENNPCLYYASVKQHDSFNIQIKDKQIFRESFLDENQTFLGLIAVEDKEILEKIEAVLRSTAISIGNRRTVGYGACELIQIDIVKQSPYQKYALCADIEKNCYMMLLSDMTMVNQAGENIGFCEEYLQEKLGVLNLKVLSCAASTITVEGYNRVWKCKIPSVKMYQKGSIFRLSFNGTLSFNRMQALSYEGIGIRKNEGYGQVLFLKSYEHLQYKELIKASFVPSFSGELQESDKETLMIIAKGYYVNLIRKLQNQYVVSQKINFGAVSKSQIGSIQTLITSCKFHPEQVYDKLKKYFSHINHKEEESKKQGVVKSHKQIERIVMQIMDGKLQELLSINHYLKKPNEIMGIALDEILTKNEIIVFKIELLLMLFRYHWKEVKIDA